MNHVQRSTLQRVFCALTNAKCVFVAGTRDGSPGEGGCMDVVPIGEEKGSDEYDLKECCIECCIRIDC